MASRPPGSASRQTRGESPQGGGLSVGEVVDLAAEAVFPAAQVFMPGAEKVVVGESRFSSVRSRDPLGRGGDSLWRLRGAQQRGLGYARSAGYL